MTIDMQLTVYGNFCQYTPMKWGKRNFADINMGMTCAGAHVAVTGTEHKYKNITIQVSKLSALAVGAPKCMAELHKQTGIMDAGNSNEECR
jgi:hypothetical protein